MGLAGSGAGGDGEGFAPPEPSRVTQFPSRESREQEGAPGAGGCEMHPREMHLLWGSRSRESRHWHPPQAPVQLRAATPVTPSCLCAPDSSQCQQGRWCLPASTSMSSRARVSAGSSVAALPSGLSADGNVFLCVSTPAVPL